MLFVLYIGYRLGLRRAELLLKQKWEDLIPKIREEAIKKSRSVLAGQFSEQLAPFLPNFPYSPTECRFIGKPIDFIVFKGMDNKEPSEIVFVEVKSGKSELSTPERRLRDVVREKKVKWVEYRIPKN
ncbi:hypothetical protein JW930_05225 [Candidatus Woesearchaeota archaeon]|nr:hypothetical protein [Candidatus Woesearchaeota archaeon]